MENTNLRPTSVKLHKDTYKIIKNIADQNGESISETIRGLLEIALSQEWVDENTDLVASIVRQQMEIVIKPHIERLAAISSKSGHMSATAAFLNVQALMDLVPPENRRDVMEMYENARKKAVEYMRTRTTDWEGFGDE